MNRYIVILAVLLIAATANAGQLSVTTLPRTITQAEHSLDTWDTVTISGTRLRSDSSGLTFSSCHHWVLLLANDTIEFSYDETIDIASYWVYVNGVNLSSCHDMVVKGGYILQVTNGINYEPGAYSADDLRNDQNRGIQIGGPTYNILIDSVKEIAVKGHANLKGTHSIWVTNEAYNVHIRDCRLFNYVYAYENRGWFSATCIRAESMEMSRLPTESDYHVWVEGCYMEDWAHTAMYMTTGKFIIENDTVVVDARNLRYLTSDGQAEHGTANAYGLQFYGVCTGSTIHDCRFLSGDTYKGGRAIQFERTSGTSDNRIQIYNNYCENHEGCCVAFTSTEGYFPCSIKIRNASRWVDIYNNTFIYIADGSVSIGDADPNQGYYRYGHAVCYSQITFDAVATPPYGITFRNNQIKSLDRTGQAYIEGVIFDKCLSYDTSFVWQNNNVTSDSIGYRFGGYDGFGDYVHVYGDTLNLLDTVSGHLAFRCGKPLDRHGYDNWAVNLIYKDENGDPETPNIMFSNSYNDYMYLADSLVVLVVDVNGTPIEGADVTATNAYGQTVIDGATDADGLISGLAIYLKDTYGLTDSSAYNDMIIAGSYSGDSDADTMTVQYGTRFDTLHMEATDLSVPCAGQVATSSSDVTGSSFNAIATYTYDTDSTIARLILRVFDDVGLSSLIYSDTMTADFGSPDTIAATGLDYSTQYWFMFRLEVAACDSIISSTGTITTSDEPCASTLTPDTVNVTSSGFTAVLAYVYDTDSTISSFEVLWDDDADSTSPLGSYVMSSPFEDTVSHPITGLSASTKYWFWWRMQVGSCALAEIGDTVRTKAAATPGAFNDAGWTLLYEEDFDNEDMFDDAQTFGTSDWLTAFTAQTGGIVASTYGVGYIATSNFDEVAMIRSTDPLPADFKVRLKVGYINFDLDNYSVEDLADANFNNHNGYLENGTYFLTIAKDTCSGTECAEDWWHLNRKMVMDVDSHYDSIDPPHPVERPVYMVTLDTAEHYGMNWLKTWDTTGAGAWDNSEWNWNVVYTYELATWYYAELECYGGAYTLRFYDADKNIIEETTPMGIDSLVGLGDPNWLYIGEPHSDDYEGNYQVDEIQLLVPGSPVSKVGGQAVIGGQIKMGGD